MEKLCSHFSPEYAFTMIPTPTQHSTGCAVDIRHVEPVSYQVSPRSPRSPQSRDEWKKTFSFTTAKLIGRGASGIVFAINDELVIKVFGRDPEAQSHLAREREIFEKLQGHVTSEYIVHFKEQWASGLVLERLDDTLRDLLKTCVPSDSCQAQPSSALTWSLECCRGFAFLHDNGIIHGDIGCQNVMVSANKHAKICDFAGSKIGDEDAWVAYEIRSQHPDYSGDQPTITTEIFAIGSLLFEIWTRNSPYFGESDSLVKEKFREGDFPLDRISSQKVMRIVYRCWTKGYRTVSEICEDLESIERSDELSSLPDQVLAPP
jgi:serine/threonine protein kinase